jgi:CRISPR-associated protein Cmr1
MTHEIPVNNENWFPRAAFGLPILTKFSTKRDPGDNQTIHLEPDVADLEHSERDPSPMFLKVIKLNGGDVLSCCLVLKQLFPEQLKLVSNHFNHSYQIGQQQLPSAISGRQMKTNEPLLVNESVYHHLARSLDLEELK